MDVGSGIFCDVSVYAQACSSTSTTQAARQLLVGAFSDRALFSCTLTGLPPRCKGRQSYTDSVKIKPALDPKGINAIVGECLLTNIPTLKKIKLALNTLMILGIT